MPSPKINNRKGGHAKNKKGRLSEKSVHGRGDGVEAEILPRPRTVPDLLAGRRNGGNTRDDFSDNGVEAEILPRPRTVPDLLAGRRNGGKTPEELVALVRPLKLTKLLLNVTVQRSLGPVQVLIPPEATVEDLIAATLRQFAKEARRPVLSADAPGFDLHYSQFSLESLDRDAKLSELGSRNFFLCPKPVAAGDAEISGGTVTTASSSCSKEAEKGSKKGLSWLSFMDFSL